MSQSERLVREATSDDVEDLLNLIKRSTSNETKLDIPLLHQSLFGLERDLKPLDQIQEVGVHIDIDGLTTNSNLCKCFVVQQGDHLIGYLIFHYFYSAWLGRVAYIDDIYVDEKARLQGVARSLIREATKLWRKQQLVWYMFTSTDKNQGLTDSLKEKGHAMKLLHGPEADWSVLRIMYNKVD